MGRTALALSLAPLVALAGLGVVVLHEVDHCRSHWRANPGAPCTVSLAAPGGWRDGDTFRASTPTASEDHRVSEPATVGLILAAAGLAVFGLFKL